MRTRAQARPPPPHAPQVKQTMNRIKQVLSERACQEVHPMKQLQMKKAIHLM